MMSNSGTAKSLLAPPGPSPPPLVIKRHSKLALFSLTRLSDRSYFRRQRVIQEISLSREIIVMCGPHMIRWMRSLRQLKGCGVLDRTQEQISCSVGREESGISLGFGLWNRRFWNKSLLNLAGFLANAIFFVTKGAVIRLAERVCKFKQGGLLISFKGCSAESVLIVRRVNERFELISGSYLHFSGDERVAHEKMVDNLNDGVLKSEKYFFL
ncbi:hypothetical protein V8E51_007808 [Hyaloscypha variabilis]